MEFNPDKGEYQLVLNDKFINVELEAPELSKTGNMAYTVLRINKKGYGNLMTLEEWQNLPTNGESIQDVIDSIPTREEVEKTIIQQGMPPKKSKQLLDLRKVTVGALIHVKDNLETVDVNDLRKYIESCSFLKVADEKFMDLVAQLHHVIRKYGRCSEKESNLEIPADSAYHMNKLHRLGIKD